MTVLLSTALTAVFFSQIGMNVFAKQEAEELSPRAKHIAEMTAAFFQGRIGEKTFEWSVGGTQYRIWNASLYVYDSHKNLVVYSTNKNGESEEKISDKYLSIVLLGEKIALPMSDSKMGVLIGEPVISDDGTIIGAVFLLKPLHEVKTAVGGLITALLISMLVVVALMMIPAYFTSKRITRPLEQMSGAALLMAQGNFNARAEEVGGKECAALAKSFNFLSDRLSATIGNLMYERNKLKAVINGINEGIIAVDNKGNVLYQNDAALKLLDGTTLVELSLKPEHQEVVDKIRGIFNGSREEYSGEIKLNGRILYFTATPLYDNAQNYCEAVILLRDVTESVRLEQTRRDYVANVSHELRTPVASIRSLADALNDGLIKTDADRIRYYGYILRESKRLSHLIDDLLELSRLQSGTVKIKKSKFDIVELVYDMAERFSKAAKESEKTLSVSLDQAFMNDPMIYSSPERVEQIMVIFADNAVKHGDAGEIVISAVKNDDEIKMSVVNNGNIVKEDIEYIFDRFYKIDKSHSGKGTGLGLSIARETAELLDGRVYAVSKDGKVEIGLILKNECVTSEEIYKG